MKKLIASIGLAVMIVTLMLLPLEGHWTNVMIPLAGFPVALVAGLFWDKKKGRRALSLSYAIIALIVLIAGSAIALADGQKPNSTLWILTFALPFIGSGLRSSER